jgi:hypothetical protein
MILQVTIILLFWVTMGCSILAKSLEDWDRPPLFEYNYIKIYSVFCGLIMPIWPIIKLFPNSNVILIFTLNTLIVLFLSVPITQIVMFLIPVGSPSHLNTKHIKNYTSRIASRLGRFFIYNTIASWILLIYYFLK